VGGTKPPARPPLASQPVFRLNATLVFDPDRQQHVLATHGHSHHRSEDRTTAAADEQALAKLQLARCAFACDFGLTGLAPRPRSISVILEPVNFPVFSLSPY